MAFILSTKENIVGVTVRGCLTGPDGAETPFDFVLQCERLSADAIERATGPQSLETAGQFFTRVTKGWLGVFDDMGQEKPFTADGLVKLFAIPNLARMAFHSYLHDVRAREKN
ncbi:hypothetical protein [Rhodoferax aquaticus]|uniref:Uncharacterized protein n=1 Tax=Rhodoferax aquaticus TaxID=2527691 RepID=A0A515ERL0_9BURK|nr:hypothetical protein [Rhodoferax aquaticus]QDL55302.1 hypothetical protein EXZ61_14625 [Rhodoferax aquaticus]